MRAKLFGNDAADAGCLDGNGGMLTRGAAAEVLTAHHDVPSLDAGNKALVDVLHAVARQLGCALGVQIAGGDNDIGINVIAVFKKQDLLRS